MPVEIEYKKISYDKKRILNKLTECFQSLSDANIGIRNGSEEYNELMDSVSEAMREIQNLNKKNDEEIAEFNKKKNVAEETRNQFYSSLQNREYATIEQVLKKIKKASVVYCDKKYSENHGKDYRRNSNTGNRVTSAENTFRMANRILAANPENDTSAYEKLDETKVKAWFKDFKSTLQQTGIDITNPMALANVCIATDRSSVEILELSEKADPDLRKAGKDFNSILDSLEESSEIQKPAFFLREGARFKGSFLQEGNILDQIRNNMKTPDKISQSEMNHLYRLFQENRLYLRSTGFGGDARAEIRFIIPDKMGQCKVMPKYNQFKKNNKEFEKQFEDSYKSDKEPPETEKKIYTPKEIKKMQANMYGLDVDRMNAYQRTAANTIRQDGTVFANYSKYNDHIGKFHNLLNDTRIRLKNNKYQNINAKIKDQNWLNKYQNNIEEEYEELEKSRQRDNHYRLLLNIASVHPDWLDTDQKRNNFLNLVNISEIPAEKRSDAQQHMLIGHPEVSSDYLETEARLLKAAGFPSLKVFMEHTVLKDETGNILFKNPPTDTRDFLTKIFSHLDKGKTFFVGDRLISMDSKGDIVAKDKKTVCMDRARYFLETIKSAQQDNRIPSQEYKSQVKYSNLKPHLNVGSLGKLTNAFDRYKDSADNKRYTGRDLDLSRESFNNVIQDYSQLMKNCTVGLKTSGKYKAVENGLEHYRKHSGNMTLQEKIRDINKIQTCIDRYMNGKTVSDLKNSYTARRYYVMKNLKKDLNDIKEAMLAINEMKKADILPTFQKKAQGLVLG